MYLFFDTETNGKAITFNAPVKKLDNWPRVTQLGWQLYDKEEKLIGEKSLLIKPDGWTIPKTEFFIENNMSTERCEEFGIPISEAIGQLIKDMEKSEYLIAHNLIFDVNVIGAEFIRLGVKSNKKLKKFCTMRGSTNICKFPNPKGGYKWPTLTELHKFLFKEGFEGAHDALDDVKACAKSFFELKKRKLILKS
jgi:DNA polymerase III epsilon subunit-like protein